MTAGLYGKELISASQLFKSINNFKLGSGHASVAWSVTIKEPEQPRYHFRNIHQYKE